MAASSSCSAISAGVNAGAQPYARAGSNLGPHPGRQVRHAVNARGQSKQKHAPKVIRQTHGQGPT